MLLLGELGYLLRSVLAMCVRYSLDYCDPFSRFDESSMRSLLPDAEDVEVASPDSIGGAGGGGTERRWVTARQDGKALNIFAKTRTQNFSESFFLNVFDVYMNELRFYEFLKCREEREGSLLPGNFFPRVFCTRLSRFKTRFLLMIENVAKTRSSPAVDVVFPLLSAQHVYPLRRVLAVLTTQAALHAEYFNDPPACVWRAGNRPPLLRIIVQPTLDNVMRRFPTAMSPTSLKMYKLFIKHAECVRSYWDSLPLTLVHGDSHVGNFFFEESSLNGAVVSTVARMYDFQCVAHEHPMRDVCYHVLSSVDEQVLSEYGGDKKLIEFYLSQFNDAMTKRKGSNKNFYGSILTFDEAWRQYRLHAVWALVSFVVSAGAGEKFFEAEKAEFLISRISKGCDRIEAHEALEEMLKSKGVSI